MILLGLVRTENSRTVDLYLNYLNYAFFRNDSIKIMVNGERYVSV